MAVTILRTLAMAGLAFSLTGYGVAQCKTSS